MEFGVDHRARPSTHRRGRLHGGASPGEHRCVPRLSPPPTPALEQLLEEQHGAVSRSQCLEHGLTDGQVEGNLRAGRWRGSLPGVYLSFTGVVPDLTRVWAAVLFGGTGATACGETAAWLVGLREDLPAVVTVAIPFERQMRNRSDVTVHSRRHLDRLRHAVRSPPQTRVEETVLDQVDAARRAERVIDVLTRACQRRLTTAGRLAATASGRSRLRWRALVREVLVDVGDGVHSPLERRWARNVERSHGLPRGERNRPEGAAGRRRYRDVRYRAWATTVELDGRAAHPDDERERDRARDNATAEDGDVTLRYGWGPVAGDACGCAAQLVRVLRSRGWTGTPRRCGPTCAVA